MEMLEQVLGPELTPDAAAAWRKAYAGIARAMVDVAYGAEAAA
jgi:hemoglobin-like flavoprotein